MRKNAQKYKQSKRKQKNGTAESICHAVSPSTAHGLPALSQVPLSGGFFEIRDKRENRREKVRLRRGLTKNRDEKSPLFFSYKVCIKELLNFFAKVHLIRQPAAATRPPLGEACECALHTRKSLYTREPKNFPITKVSFAYFSFQRKVRCLLFFSKEKYGQLKYFRSRLRNWIASAMCGARMISLSARSAIVRATRRIRS